MGKAKGKGKNKHSIFHSMESLTSSMYPSSATS